MSNHFLEISDDELLKRYSAIKPIISIEGEKFYCREFTLQEIRKTSFNFDKKSSKGEAADFSILKEIAEIRTLHTFGHYSLFKPSVAEVLAQIPEPLLESVAAFEITDWPRVSLDINKYSRFHVAETTLYGKN